MICPICWKRHAPFFPEDFMETPKGFLPRNPEAEKRREIIFNSNQIQLCGNRNCEVAAISSSCFAEKTS